MEQHIAAASLLNTYSVAADIINSGGIIKISGLPQMKTEDFISVTQVAPVAEVSQVITIGASTPAVTAATRYAFLIGNTGPRVGGYQKPLTKISYTSPSILTGSAFVDRQNLYQSMATKVNNLVQSLAVTAYAVITVAQTNSVAFAVGEIVTETVSGATGINISGTTGTLTIGIISGTWSGIATGTSASGTLTGSIAGASTSTTHVTVAGIGLRLVDNAGYWNSTYTRFGVSSVQVTNGFASTDLVVTTAGVYGLGQGTRMLLDVPVKELLTDNLARGLWSFNVDHAPSVVPTAGATYDLFTLRFRTKPQGDIGAMALSGQDVLYNFWLNHAGSTSSIAQMLTALQAL